MMLIWTLPHVFATPHSFGVSWSSVDEDIGSVPGVGFLWTGPNLLSISFPYFSNMWAAPDIPSTRLGICWNYG